MNRDQKAAVIDEVAGQIEKADAIFAVDYRGISVPQAADLRTIVMASTMGPGIKVDPSKTRDLIEEAAEAAAA